MRHDRTAVDAARWEHANGGDCESVDSHTFSATEGSATAATEWPSSIGPSPARPGPAVRPPKQKESKADAASGRHIDFDARDDGGGLSSTGGRYRPPGTTAAFDAGVEESVPAPVRKICTGDAYDPGTPAMNATWAERLLREMSGHTRSMQLAIRSQSRNSYSGLQVGGLMHLQ